MLLSLTVPLLVAVSASQADAPRLEVKNCSFGESFVFNPAECTIQVTNGGNKKALVKRVVPGSPADSVTPPHFELAPGETVKLKARVSPEVASGMTSRVFLLDLGEKQEFPTYVQAQGFVSSVLDDPKPSIDFDDVFIDGPAVTREVVFTSREVKDLRVTGVVEAPDFIEASVDKDGRTVRLAYRKSAPLGPRSSDRVVVSLNAPQQSKASVMVNANITGDIASEKDPFPLGTVRTDENREYFVPLKSRSGKPVRIGAVKLDGWAGAKVDVLDCEPAARDCKRVRITGGKGAGFGPLLAVLKVELSDSKRELPVRLTALALPPGVEPAEEPAEAEQTAEQKRLMADPRARGANDIHDVLKAKVRESKEPAPPGRGPLLKWSVANEDAVYGYVIFRGDAEQGPVERVNKDIIRAGAFEEGYANSYQWRDTTAVAGRTYWYSIGLINKDGSKDSLTGPQLVRAK